MAGKSFAQTLSDARLPASGIRKNSRTLARRGIAEARTEEIEQQILEIES